MVLSNQPIPKSSKSTPVHFEIKVDKEGDKKIFLIGLIENNYRYKIDGLSGWNNNTVTYHVNDRFGYQFHNESIKGKAIIQEKLMTGDRVRCCVKRVLVGDENTPKVFLYFIKNGKHLKSVLTLDDGEYFPIIGIDSPGAVVIPTPDETELIPNNEGMT